MTEIIKHTADLVMAVRADGQYAFTLDSLIDGIPKKIKNIKKDLDRLKAKGEIQNIRRGFYTIIPPEFRNLGYIPVDFYISQLMHYLQKQYYVGLYSAAMFHGAAHQQPQEFYVITSSPKPRSVFSEKYIINFKEKTNFPANGITKLKSQTGYFFASSPELTFLDLIYFEKTIGGLSRIATVLMELNETLSISAMKDAIKNNFPVSTLQRAGYFAEHILKNSKLTALIENNLKNIPYQTALLKSSGPQKGLMDDKWKLVINVRIQSDF
jgi:predicted transcriptional regulator of viral defense system